MLSRCPICPGDRRCVPGDGPTPCSAMFIGERPGQDEDRGGRPFIGRAGREFNENYLISAGMSREEIYLTNTVKCGTSQNRKPTAEEISVCSSHHLRREFWECNPDIVVLMGSTACSLVPEINLVVQHGILQRVKLFDTSVWVYPVFHPASGLHDGKMMIPLLEDFRELRRIVTPSGYIQPNAPVNRHPIPAYAELTSPYDIDCILNAPATVREDCAVDTETVNGRPWCLSFSIEEGTGWMVHRDSREAIEALNRNLHRQKREVTVHHGLYARDVEFCLEMGLDIGNLVACDTAHEAYHLGNMRQGLKELGYRLLGVKMCDYLDLVMPYSREAVIKWLDEAAKICADNPRYEYKEIKSRAKKYLEAPTTVMLAGVPHKTIAKSHPLLATISRIHRHVSKTTDNSESQYDPWSSWEEMDKNDDGTVDEERAEGRYMIESRIGKMPSASLEQVTDRDKVIDYSCEDARVTKEIRPILMALANDVGRDVYVGDYDV